MYFVEYAIGLKANAPKNEIAWTLRSLQKSGCHNFRFNNRVVDLLASPVTPNGRQMKIEVRSSGPFTLKIKRDGHTRTLAIQKGSNTFVL